MIRDIILTCGCKVELTIIPPGSLDLFKDIPIQGVLTYPCALHSSPPKLRIPNTIKMIQGLS